MLDLEKVLVVTSILPELELSSVLASILVKLSTYLSQYLTLFYFNCKYAQV